MNPIPQDSQTLVQLPGQHHLGIELELFQQLYGHASSQFRSFLSAKHVHMHRGNQKLISRSQCFLFPMVSEQGSDELLCLVANFVGFIPGPSSKRPGQ
jgi:hypothetical protein